VKPGLIIILGVLGITGYSYYQALNAIDYNYKSVDFVKLDPNSLQLTVNTTFTVSNPSALPFPKVGISGNIYYNNMLFGTLAPLSVKLNQGNTDVQFSFSGNLSNILAGGAGILSVFNTTTGNANMQFIGNFSLLGLSIPVNTTFPVPVTDFL
jgi:hypothetical protein